MLDVNSYFEGKVKSVAFKGESLPATIGVISPGEYDFDTSKYETITIVSGTLLVKFPDTDEWQSFSSGDSFEVAANKVFSVHSKGDTAYLCTYA